MDSMVVTVDIGRFMLHFLNKANVCHLGGHMPQMKGLTAICSGMAGYTTYGVISAERMAICDFLCANGPYVTLATSNNLCRRTIRTNALMVCAALLQAGVTRFVLLAYMGIGSLEKFAKFKPSKIFALYSSCF